MLAYPDWHMHRYGKALLEGWNVSMRVLLCILWDDEGGVVDLRAMLEQVPGMLFQKVCVCVCICIRVVEDYR